MGMFNSYGVGYRVIARPDPGHRVVPCVGHVGESIIRRNSYVIWKCPNRYGGGYCVIARPDPLTECPLRWSHRRTNYLTRLQLPIGLSLSGHRGVTVLSLVRIRVTECRFRRKRRQKNHPVRSPHIQDPIQQLRIPPPTAARRQEPKLRLCSERNNHGHMMRSKFALEDAR